MPEMMNDKHAYLIIAHNNFEQLALLISLLDDERNDIYLHIDKKAATFSPDSVKTSHSKLILIDRIDVRWGGHSQIQCEMNLLKAAAANHYQYYHLLSGIDLPLKSQDEIHAFFDKNVGKEFIKYDEKANKTKNFLSRTQYYHFLQNIYGNKRKGVFRLLKIIERISIELQKLLKIHRKEIVPLYKGANWFSITDTLVQYVLNNQDIIKKQFSYSYCADEVFLQSIAMASPYRDNIVPTSYRAIDWNRGNPYIYRSEDVPQLLASSALFGRKFDCNVDKQAVDLVVEYLTNI